MCSALPSFVEELRSLPDEELEQKIDFDAAVNRVLGLAYGLGCAVPVRNLRLYAEGLLEPGMDFDLAVKYLVAAGRLLGWEAPGHAASGEEDVIAGTDWTHLSRR